MQTYLHGRDMITTQEWTKDELDTVIDVALDLKRRRALGEQHALLDNKVLAMLFFFSSTRTRASFEAGMAQLGGHAMFLDSTSTQIGHGDTWKEIGEILGRYDDGIAIRNVNWEIGNKYIRAVAEASRTPVLNMQCDVYHPFQALADLLTRWRATPGDDTVALTELAGLAEHRGLTAEATLLRLAVLLAEPDHEGANEALGHTRRKDGWWTKHGRRKRRVSELDQLAGKWKEL